MLSNIASNNPSNSNNQILEILSGIETNTVYYLENLLYKTDIIEFFIALKEDLKKYNLDDDFSFVFFDCNNLNIPSNVNLYKLFELNPTFILPFKVIIAKEQDDIEPSVYIEELPFNHDHLTRNNILQTPIRLGGECTVLARIKLNISENKLRLAQKYAIRYPHAELLNKHACPVEIQPFYNGMELTTLFSNDIIQDTNYIIFKLLANIASKLSKFHSEKRYHGDLKLENILFSANENAQVEIIDWPRSDIWQGHFTPCYLSPDHFNLLKGENRINLYGSSQRDAYAFGQLILRFLSKNDIILRDFFIKIRHHLNSIFRIKLNLINKNTVQRTKYKTAFAGFIAAYLEEYNDFMEKLKDFNDDPLRLLVLYIMMSLLIPESKYRIVISDITPTLHFIVKLQEISTNENEHVINLCLSNVIKKNKPEQFCRSAEELFYKELIDIPEQVASPQCKETLKMKLQPDVEKEQKKNEEARYVEQFKDDEVTKLSSILIQGTVDYINWACHHQGIRHGKSGLSRAFLLLFILINLYNFENIIEFLNRENNYIDEKAYKKIDKINFTLNAWNIRENNFNSLQTKQQRLRKTTELISSSGNHQHSLSSFFKLENDMANKPKPKDRKMHVTKIILAKTK